MTCILDRYIVKELGPPFAIGAGVFTFFLVIDRIYQLTDLVITKNVPFVLVMPLLIYMLPAFLALTLPMATLVAVLLVTGRLAGDLEVAALKASGVSPLRLLLTVLDITRDRSASTPASPSGRRRAGRSPTACFGGWARRTG
jgi:lipopolysaccharide export system permease protein